MTTKFHVYCQSSAPYFEWIASFNCIGPTYGYANDCARTNKAFTYRVTKGSKVLREFKGSDLPVIGAELIAAVGRAQEA